MPAAAVHVVAIANGVPLVIDTKGWCTDLTPDPITNAASATNANVISEANGSFGDGSLAMSEQSSVSGGGGAAQSSALVQMGFRDVLHAQAAGTELVPITMHRHVSGTWTLTGGDGGTLDRFIYRSFTLTLWERTEPSGPQSWTRRLVIDDDDLNLLNGDESYPFEVLPGKDLILSIYRVRPGQLHRRHDLRRSVRALSRLLRVHGLRRPVRRPDQLRFRAGTRRDADGGQRLHRLRARALGAVRSPKRRCSHSSGCAACAARAPRASAPGTPSTPWRAGSRRRSPRRRGRWPDPSARRGRRARRAQPGIGRTSAFQLGSKKNGNDRRSRRAALRTRCGVERYSPPVMRSSMSPRLQTNEPGIGGASIQPRSRLHLQPPASSCSRIVSTP